MQHERLVLPRHMAGNLIPHNRFGRPLVSDAWRADSRAGVAS
jgi:hypothetical protein